MITIRQKYFDTFYHIGLLNKVWDPDKRPLSIGCAIFGGLAELKEHILKLGLLCFCCASIVREKILLGIAIKKFVLVVVETQYKLKTSNTKLYLIWIC